LALVTRGDGAAETGERDVNVNKKKEIEVGQSFVALVEEIGPEGILDHLATACEVASLETEDRMLRRAWDHVVPEVERLAKRVRQLQERAASRRRWELASAASRLEGDFIGRETTYLGGEWPRLAGSRVRIEAVFREEGGSDEIVKITTNDALRAAGGVSARDRVEVRPVRCGGQLSFIASDPYALDLECFAALRRPLAQTASFTKSQENNHV
jgi:hypothetical protein